MKVMLVNGSPHHEGCTYTALQEVAKALNADGIETKNFWIGIRPISGCLSCGSCSAEGKCAIDDIVNVFVEEAKDCDAFVFGAPVHFASANGSMISFMDRAFYSGKKALEFKPAASVVSCRRGGASATFDELNKYFTIRNMPVVSSQYWNQVHGNTPEEVVQDAEGMQTMRTLGHNMAWLLKCIDAGRAAGVELPVIEPQIKTNFIR
ncbi:MAG: flavodoxin family protein [Muribaculaceae bacterium]|nr:flavodoxin family protein [Muribaculaceae bacterium]